jgi:hypothetical protein
MAILGFSWLWTAYKFNFRKVGSPVVEEAV